MLMLLGVARADPYLGATYWHAHEMVFGFAAAVLAGFLLTAVSNWTQRETLVGAPLIALCVLWLLGRVAIAFATLLPRGIPAIVDVAFLPTLIVVLARPLFASKNRRNFVVLGILTALLAANVAVHLDALGLAPGWRRRGCLVGVDVVVVVILVIAGRVFPMFTRNATGMKTIRSSPRLDILTVGAIVLLCVLDAVIPDHMATAVVAASAGVLAAARTVHWGARHSVKHPLLWILHLGYAWIPFGLVLRAIAVVDHAIPPSLATHALTAGAIGSLTLGMMARVALGHTGRVLTVSKPVAAAFALITLAALVRVLGPLAQPGWYLATVLCAGSLWSLAFLLYLVSYTPFLLFPRIDGKPG
jgi:uncharacterized protein involved in response to NO